ncbi:MAG: hypothetical protein BJBARM4_0802 [Candidatus Parvarchaeum acidiphilum ARMAN-4]|jgi:hypothetical protein|uniref:Uncharacterized protein n=1 Tax=Candidatus Parvarchaeum acidiphilum ARMAN-4 TaxID=662760 RepID=D2EGA2_PARA4|nr:hypothetical protein [Candidatus Parvarchaeum acidiphilum ARMAN-4]EEZ92605.1 MAG: hypothetical protein BJBARM4_0802 [Candidatus Parvarchaeum acidiphilum ARMAN-4]
MDQSNYISDSEIRGNVYNETVYNTFSYKNAGFKFLCDKVRGYPNGEFAAGFCIITPEKELKVPMENSFSHYLNAPDFDLDFKYLPEDDNQWTLSEIKLRK